MKTMIRNAVAALLIAGAAPMTATAQEKAQERAQETAQETDATSGAALLAASGIGSALDRAESYVRIDLDEFGQGLSKERIDYIAAAFNAEALNEAVGKDLEAALDAGTRVAVDEFYSSELGKKVAAVITELQEPLKASGGEILRRGAALREEETRGPLFDALLKKSGFSTIDENLIRSGTHVYLLLLGDLNGLPDAAAVRSKVDKEFSTTLALMQEYTVHRFAFALRGLTAQELQAFDAFLSTEAGQAFVAASVSATKNRYDDAVEDLTARINETKKKG